MRKFCNNMSSDGAAKYPSSRRCAIFGILEKVRSRYIRFILQFGFHQNKLTGKLSNERMLCRVVTNGVRFSNVRFPVFKNRTQIKKHNVIILDRSGGRIIRKYRDCVYSGPDNSLVPMLRYAEFSFGERKNVLLNLFLSSARPDEASFLNFLEHCERLVFCRQKRSKAIVQIDRRSDYAHNSSRCDLG